MKPFHLHVWLDSRAAALTCQWFGLSAIHAAGSAHYVLRPDAGATLVPHPCLIDIRQRGRACFNGGGGGGGAGGGAGAADPSAASRS